jgi:hypothetical protein
MSFKVFGGLGVRGGGVLTPLKRKRRVGCGGRQGWSVAWRHAFVASFFLTSRGFRGKLQECDKGPGLWDVLNYMKAGFFSVAGKNISFSREESGNRLIIFSHGVTESTVYLIFISPCSPCPCEIYFLKRQKICRHLILLHLKNIYSVVKS